ncbi:cytochrome c-type biogenesis protein F2 [Salmonella enterica subsp. arizonae]|uniref:Cytochrome c-type biogenesis protein F2 n=1 Tax=Salmonella enterica subsp. arizonae TaxID=59203 RepID=A0A379S4A6_SALER|nr:cytochrome c-type biogenesis protein F2 [Salmonella enterica subsp. arizonae]SUG41987.1 cytochrome c-type biogenesis protein F2 [Salmonella enterica subsp. arizonae]
MGGTSVLQTVCPLDMGRGLLMALGGLLCLADPRYRRRPRRPAPEAV